MKKTTGIAVVGSGYWGKNLVRNYYELGNLRLICDRNEEVLTGFQEQYPGIEVCVAFHQVLSRDDVDAVVISTPAETHYRMAREALLAGKHAYVEKPLVLSEEEGEELIGLAKENNLTLMVGHLLQYHPVFERLKDLAREGQLGRINYIYSHRLNLGKIRREENILWSFAPHDISMILALAGEEPETVCATGGNYLHKKIADVTTTHMEFPSGLQAHIFVSWLHPFKEQKLVVVGDRRMAVFDDTLPWEDKLLLYSHEIQWQQNIPVPSKADPERLEIPKAEPLRRECEHFLHCMTNGEKPATDGREGLRVLKVLNASQRSLDQDGIKVHLDQGAVDSGQGSEVTPVEHPEGTRFNGVKRSPRLNSPVGNPRKMRSAVVNELHPDGIKDKNRLHWAGAVNPVQLGKEDGGLRYFIHPTAVIDENCWIGSDTKIWHFSHILSNSRIGEGCNIGQNVVIGPDVEIGKGCKIQNNVSVYKGVTLEDGVFCGPSMVFTNIYNPRAEIRKMDQVRLTLVKHGATIGANATVICGVKIGRYAFIGAGAVVTKDVPDHALMLGNPARKCGWTCHCGERLDQRSEVRGQKSDSEKLECLVCGNKYEKDDNGLKEVFRQD